MLDPAERLRNAIVEGNLLITKRLLFRFPELWLNIDHRNGWNNLHYSSYTGNYLICFHLISFINQFKDKNEDLSNILGNPHDMLTFDKLSALHLAIEKFHLQTLHYLLQEFPGSYWLNHQGGPNNQTPLHYCCIFGFNEGLKLLLDKGADYNILDKSGNNILHLAFEFGNLECIKTLVNFLYITSTKNNLKLVKSFESCKNNDGWIPIELSIDFKLTRVYKSFKKQLTNTSGTPTANNSDLDDVLSRSSSTTTNTITGTTNTPTNTSPNKILASPILSLNEFQKRSHSQSLPTQTENEIPFQVNTSAQTARQRANTTLDKHAFVPPSTPVIKKTPSLKSITISPSIRLNTDIDHVDMESTSSSGTSSSPIKVNLPMAPTNSTMSFKEEADSPSSIAAKIAFTSTSSSRKNSYSNSNNSTSNNSQHSPVKPTQTSLNSAETSSPSKLKKSINSISFSRIR